MAATHYLTQLERSGTTMEIAVHPCPGAEKIILNIPGYRGSREGYNDKYVTLSDHLVGKGFAVVRMPNIERPLHRYREELVYDVLHAARWIDEHSRAICGRYHAELCLMGFSMGGFAAAVVAERLRQVRSILLLEPATPGTELTGSLPRPGLARFRGAVRIVVGDHDAVGEKVGRSYHDAFTQASQKELVVIDRCDHQFKGTRNGQIMAKAPLWAFAGETTFPSPDGAPILY